ncbi:MAG: carbohydrate ABC transporter permease [Ardenticatenales bacterium]|nr:carbohydrate ABC transporter permease [Ardenticatenales bacterium]
MTPLRWKSSLLYLSLIGGAFLFLLPLLWMVKTAFQEARLIYANPTHWLPWPPTLANFREAWALIPFMTYLRNSLLIALLAVPGAVLSSSMAGFAFASLPARGRGVLFALLLLTLALPAQATLIPTFLLFVKLRWVNTFLPLIVPHWTAGAIYVFLFRQFFRRLPQELYDSAELDGCSPWQLYWYIALPLARPLCITVALFTFIASWNDFQGPLLYLTDGSKFTLPVGLAFFQGPYVTQLHHLMPLALLSLLPPLLLYLVGQRYLIEGLEVRG